jgi:hypothetical protein
VRSQAVRLLETFFATDTEAVRKTVFGQAFGDCAWSPMRQIVWSGSAAEFAAHAVDTLLAFGCAERGRHCLSLLLKTMAEIRGRQTEPDYTNLQPPLDAGCATPTREEEQSYLARLLEETEEQARLYSSLYGIAEIRRRGEADSLLRAWKDDPGITLLRHNPRKSEVLEKGEVRDYDDILTAFAEVRREALFGAPGSGKTTTLAQTRCGIGAVGLAGPGRAAAAPGRPGRLARRRIAR